MRYHKTVAEKKKRKKLEKNIKKEKLKQKYIERKIRAYLFSCLLVINHTETFIVHLYCISIHPILKLCNFLSRYTVNVNKNSTPPPT